MARKPRLYIEGGIYHVILRGNGGEKVFFSGQDRTYLFLLIQEGIERFQYRLHAYCLMSNHIHLVIQVGSVPLSKIIQNISFRYTRYINKRKSRAGHLFQGRYKAILIDADSYMLELVRYIHNNPVRAGMTSKAVDYKWSSHQAYLGLHELPYLTTDWILGQFAKKVAKARNKFSRFVNKGRRDGQRKEFYKGKDDNRILGDDLFLQKVLSQQIISKEVSLDEIIEYVCLQNRVTENELQSPSRQRKLSEIRGVIGWLVVQFESTTLSEMAKRFNRDLSTVSRAVRNIEKRKLHSEEFAKQLDKSMKALS